MRILLTGNRGFVGRHLEKELINSGHTVLACNTSVRNLLRYGHWPVEEFVIDEDLIIHLAAWTKAGDFCLHHQAEQWIINQQLNTNVLRLRQFTGARFITMGTSCGYDPALAPKLESHYMVGSPDSNLYSYAMTKRMLLVGLEAQKAQYGWDYSYYVPNTMYGPDFELDDTHFIFDLIKKIVDAKYTGTKVVLWGDGYQKRELVYIDDVVKWIVSNLETDVGVANLAPGVEYTIREYAGMICRIVGYNENLIEYDTTAFTGVRSKKLVNSLGIKYTPIEEGLLHTIEYYIKAKYGM